MLAATLRPSLIPLLPTPQYDNKASDLTKAGMEDGVSKTGCFLLFLSRGVMARAYVQVSSHRHLEVRGSAVLKAVAPSLPSV